MRIARPGDNTRVQREAIHLLHAVATPASIVSRRLGISVKEVEHIIRQGRQHTTQEQEK